MRPTTRGEIKLARIRSYCETSHALKPRRPSGLVFVITAYSVREQVAVNPLPACKLSRRVSLLRWWGETSWHWVLRSCKRKVEAGKAWEQGYIFIPLSLEPISLSPSYWCYSLLTRTKLSHFVYPPFSPHSVATPGRIIDLMEKGITKCLVWTPDPSGRMRKGLGND